MNLRWFTSSTVRHACAMRKHVRNMLSAQRDILSPQAVQSVTDALDEFSKSIQANLKKEELVKEMEKLDQVASKSLKPYPNHVWRENVEVFLVALAVAMGIRTFFVQPFKIPTGSMQPTLFGITSTPDFSKVTSEAEAIEQVKLRDGLEPATGWQSVKEWFGGYSFLSYKAEEDGPFNGMSRPLRFLLFNIKQTIWVAGKPHNLWFPPDSGGASSFNWGNLFGYVQAVMSALPVDDSSYTDLERRMGLRRGQPFSKGEDILKLKVVAGDHLFVDRVSYNFRKPERGEIAVFATAGTRIPQQDQFYIKRLVAMGGEKVQIGDDRHLIIDGKRLDKDTPHFEKVYSFDPNKPPHESEFSGHVNDTVAVRMGRPRGQLAPLFPNQEETVTLPPDTYMVMGDNTMNSFDSRAWGEFAATNIIGKSFIVYWPITSRFGWGNR